MKIEIMLRGLYTASAGTMFCLLFIAWVSILKELIMNYSGDMFGELVIASLLCIFFGSSTLLGALYVKEDKSNDKM